jgi:predicted RNA-binding protein with PUA-like domain
MTSSTWLVKSEPSTYSFDALLTEKKTRWDGIRNYTARNFLRAMKAGDTVLFYHSGEGKEIVGLARVANEAYPDPTSTEDWSAVDIVPLRRLEAPVTLATIKATPKLAKMLLVKQSRLSVMPVTQPEFDEILKLATARLPRGRETSRTKARK